MTRFTVEQYDKAIAHLQDCKTQLEPNGHGCHCCGDSGHQAFECGHNPLVAMEMCVLIAERAGKMHDAIHRYDAETADLATLREVLQSFHEVLHSLCGEATYMGRRTGPALVVLP